MGIDWSKYDEWKKNKTTSSVNNTTSKGIDWNKYDLRKSAGLDTLSSDLETYYNNLNGIDGWKDANYMNDLYNTTDSLNKRIKAASDYYTKYGADENTLNSYKELSSNFDDILKTVSSNRSAYSNFSSEEDYNKAVDDYNKRQDWIKSYTSNADYEEMRTKGESAKNDLKIGQHGNYFGVVNNPVSFVRNEIPEERKNKGYGAFVNQYLSEDWEKRINQMDDDEVNYYNYLLGKEGMDSANKYLSSLVDDLSYRAASNMVNERNNTIKELGTSYRAGLENAFTGLDSFVRNMIGGSDKYNDKTILQYADSMMRSDNEGAFKVASDIINGIGLMTPSLLTGGAIGQTMFGLSAAGNYYNEAIEMGMDRESALISGAIKGALEVGLERAIGGIASLGGKGIGGVLGKLTGGRFTASSTMLTANILNKILPNATSTVAKVFKSIASIGIMIIADMTGKMAGEFVEEGSQDVLAPFVNLLAIKLTGDDLDYDWEADIPTLEEFCYTGLIGALTAGVLELPTTYVNNIRLYNLGNNIGTENITSLADIGIEYDDRMVSALSQVVKNNPEYQNPLNIGKLYANAIDNYSAQMNKSVESLLEERGIDGREARMVSKWIKENLNETGSFTDEQISKMNQIDPGLVDEFNKKIVDKDKAYWNAIRKVEGVSETSLDDAKKNVEENFEFKTKLDSISKNYSALNKLKAMHDEALKTSVKNDYYKAKSDFELKNTDVSGNVNSDISVDALHVDEDGNNHTISDFNVTLDKNNKILQLTTEEGNKVNVKDVVFKNQDTSVLYNAAAQIMSNTKTLSDETINSIINNYEKSGYSNPVVYMAEMVSAYVKGRMDVNTKTELSNDEVNPQAYVLREAYRMGKESAMLQGNAKKKGKGNVDTSKINVEKLSDDQKWQVETFNRYAKMFGVDISLYDSKADSRTENGAYNPLTQVIEIDINAGEHYNALMLHTFGHELGHHLRNTNKKAFNQMVNYIIDEFGQEYFDSQVLGQRNQNGLDEETAMEEVVCNACANMLTDAKAYKILERISKENTSLKQIIVDFVKDFIKKIEEFYGIYKSDFEIARRIDEVKDFKTKLQNVFLKGLMEDVGTEENESNSSEEEKNSIRKIIGISGKDYGYGVYLDSTLLDGFNEQERIQMVKERVKELGGSVFSAFDNNGNAINITIAKWERKFINEKGNNVNVSKDLAIKKYPKRLVDENKTKQDSIDLIEELIITSTFNNTEKAIHKHDWLDENGKNDWEKWYTYLEDKNGEIWKATLNITNAITGEKILYDISKIENVEKASSLAISPHAHTISSNNSVVNKNVGDEADYVKRSERFSQYLKESTKKYGEVEKAAIEHFGLTDNFRTAGYILADGKMLDFSGVHWLEGASKSYIEEWKKKNDIRQVDHEDIFEAFDIASGKSAGDNRLEFLKRGNIRISPEAPGIDIAVEPTSEQYEVIRNFLKENPYNVEGFYVDIEGETKRAEKLVYNGKVNAERVINDIKYYYNKGIAREQSEIMKFHNSDYDMKYSFRGENSALRNTNLDVAKQMDELGIDSEKIRLATGWFKSYDGKWRYEINDSKATLKLPSLIEKEKNKARAKLEKLKKDYSEGKIGRVAYNNKLALYNYEAESSTIETRYKQKTFLLGDILKHKELYEAYPEFVDIDVRFYHFTDGTLGQTSGALSDIVLNDKYLINSKGMLSTLIHEIQHQIQSVEGFGRGSNTREAEGDIQDEDIERKRKFRDEMLNPARDRLDEYVDSYLKKHFPRDIELHKLYGGTYSNGLLNAILYYKDSALYENYEGMKEAQNNAKKYKRYDEALFRKIDEMVVDILYLTDKYNALTSKETPFHRYQRVAGEIEARDVQSRINMSKAERKATRPDIDRTDAIVKYSDRILMGTEFSGGGMLEAGLLYKMIEKEFAVEWDEKIATVYSDNWGDHIYAGKDNGDVLKFDISKHKKDLFYFHASPVCHNFSSAKQKRVESPLDIASARKVAHDLEVARPQVFTVENAPAYLNSKSLQIIVDKLVELGYKYDVNVYNAADYGSATSRERCILRAVKTGTLPSKPNKVEHDNSWDKATSKYWDSLKNAKARDGKAIADFMISAIRNTKKLQKYLNADGTMSVDKPLLIISTNTRHEVTFAEYGELCPTLTTKCGEGKLILPGEHISFKKPNNNIKQVSPEFMGAIQGLEGYKYGKADTRAFTIIGNGIPTHLTKAVVGGLLESAYQQTHDGEKLYSQRNTSVPTFYSHMSKVIDGIKTEKVGANSIIPYLKGKGVKDEEIKWSGIQTFLEGKKSVTKAELQEFAKGSMLQIEEKTLSSTGEQGYRDSDTNKLLTKAELKEQMDRYAEENDYDYEVESYHDYIQIYFFEKGSNNEAVEVIEISKENVGDTKWGEYKLAGGSNYREILFKMPNSDYSNQAMGTHWGEEKGVLAHARLQDFETPNGKMLFVEEIQSDWHNAFQRFYGKKDISQEERNILLEIGKLNEEVKKYSGKFDEESRTRRRSLSEKYKKLKIELSDKYNYNLATFNFSLVTPEAPFSNGKYIEYVMKKLIRMAAEGGYDSIGWTTGKIQEERWSDEFAEGYRIEYDQDIPKFMNKYGKQWGAKVEKVSIDEEDVWSVELTPEMKESVMTEGQPLYSNRAEWHTGMTNAEVTMLEKRANTEKNSNNKYLSDTDKWLLYNNGKNTYFAIYSLNDVDEKNGIMPTILYASKGNRAIQDDAIVKAITTRYGGISYGASANRGTRTLGRLFQRNWDVLVRNNVHGNAGVGTRSNKRDVNISIGNTQYRLRRAFRNCLENITEVSFTRRRGGIIPSVKTNSIKKSDRTSSEKRTGIVEALLPTAKNSREKNLLLKYKNGIEHISEWQDLLKGINAEIKELSFSEGKRDMTRLKALQDKKSYYMDLINKYDKQLLNLESTETLKDLMKRESELITRTLQAESKKAMSEQKAKYNMMYSMLKQEAKDKVAATRENFNRQEYLKRVEDDIKSMVNMALHPKGNDEINRIPDFIKQEVLGFVKSIDTSSKRLLKGGDSTLKDNAWFNQAIKLGNVLANTRNEFYEPSLYVSYDFTRDIEALKKLIDEQTIVKDSDGKEITQPFTLNKMTSDQLHMLSRAIRQMKKAITDFNKLYQSERYKSVNAANVKFKSDMSKYSDYKQQGRTTEALKDFVFDKNMRPIFFFERLGEVGKEWFNQLVKGDDTLMKHTKQVKEFVESLDCAKEVNEWKNDLVEVKLSNEETFKATPLHLMGLYELSKRKEGLEALKKSGFRIGNFTRKVNKLGTKAEEVIVSDVKKFTDTDKDIIREALTERQIYIADKLQNYMATQGAEWGNEVTRIRFQEEMFKSLDYYPISRDGRLFDISFDKPSENASLYALMNASFTKELSENANQDVMIWNILDVFSNHISGMMQYNAYTLPILNIMKWLNARPDDNGRSVRSELVRVFGSKSSANPISNGSGYAIEMLTNIIKAYNGTEALGDTSDGAILGLFHKHTLTQIAWNISSWLQQPLAITRAALVIKPKYLFGGALSVGQYSQTVKEMEEHNGIAIRKRMGFYDVNVTNDITRIVNPSGDTLMSKISEAGLKGAEFFDNVTWANIWRACKLQVEAENPGLTGDEYWNKVNDLFNETIYKTQVVDSILTKTEWSRGKGVLKRYTSAFMSEPVATASVMNALIYKYNMELRTGKPKSEVFKKYKGEIASTIAIYCVSQILDAAVKSVISAYRDEDKDEEFWRDKFGGSFAQEVIDELVPFNKLPIFNTIYELFKTSLGKFTGWDINGFDQQKLIIQYQDSLNSALTTFGKMMRGENTNYTTWYGIYNLLKVVSSQTGLPIATASREVIDLWNHTVGVLFPDLKITKKESNKG